MKTSYRENYVSQSNIQSNLIKNMLSTHYIQNSAIS